jgi:hypothetical protein
MRWRWWFALLVPFTAANLLASMLLAIPYGVASWRWSKGCLEIVAKRDGAETRIWGCPGAQSLGCNVIWYASERRWNQAWLRVHERCHAIQGLIAGLIGHVVFVPLAAAFGIPWWLGVIAGQLLFGTAYGAHFMAAWALQLFGPCWKAYMKIWAEKQAYRIHEEFENGKRPDAFGA